MKGNILQDDPKLESQRHSLLKTRRGWSDKKKAYCCKEEKKASRQLNPEIAQVRRLYALTLQHYCRHATLAWTSLACPSGQQNRKGAPGSPEMKVVDCFYKGFHIGSVNSL